MSPTAAPHAAVREQAGARTARPGGSLVGTYRPRALALPPRLGLARDVAPGEDAGIRDLRYDFDTLFYDVFRSPDRRTIVAVGPPLRNLAAALLPLRVRCAGRVLPSASRPFHPEDSVHVLEIDAGEDLFARDGPLELTFEWRAFTQRVVVPPSPLAAAPPVDLTLVTLQKDNPPEWIRNWCLHHHRVHGVRRVVIYDNGSADLRSLTARLADLGPALDVRLVRWRFPYGDERNPFCQHGALNHCAHAFGARSAFYLNLDVDEYLVNGSGSSLAAYLRRRLAGGVSLSLAQIVVPARGAAALSRTGASAAAPVASPVHDRRKTIFRYQGMRGVFTHHVSVQEPAWWFGGRTAWDLLQWLHRWCGFRIPLSWAPDLGLERHARPRELCFRHYEGLFTDWKSVERSWRAGVRPRRDA